VRAWCFRGRVRQPRVGRHVAARLRDLGVRVFYDEYAAAEMWGTDLYVLLDNVYRKRVRFTVMFVSRHYASKPWTQHERQSAQARALTDLGPYLLPVRLDDAELPGLRPTVGYVDARRTSPEELTRLIQQKLLVTPGKPERAETSVASGSPRTGQVAESLAKPSPKWPPRRVTERLCVRWDLRGAGTANGSCAATPSQVKPVDNQVREGARGALSYLVLRSH
jgi:hypothetical protein